MKKLKRRSEAIAPSTPSTVTPTREQAREHIAFELTKHRLALSLNQTEVAEKLGVLQQQVSGWERGIVPNRITMAKLRKLYPDLDIPDRLFEFARRRTPRHPRKGS